MRRKTFWQQLLICLSVTWLPCCVCEIAVGERARIKNIPLQVLIQYQYADDGDLLIGHCSGIIVHQRWILTAKECVERNGVDMQLSVDYDYDGFDKPYPKHSIVTSIIKPRPEDGLELPPKSGIALIRVRQNFRLKHFSLTMKGFTLKPLVPIPPYEVPRAERRFLTAGFGKSGIEYSDKFEGMLYSTTVFVTDANDCFNNTLNSTGSYVQVCVKSPQGCFGDSGSPLLQRRTVQHLPDQVKLYDAYGIMTFGGHSEQCEAGSERGIIFDHKIIKWVTDKIHRIDH